MAVIAKRTAGHGRIPQPPKTVRRRFVIKVANGELSALEEFPLDIVCNRWRSLERIIGPYGGFKHPKMPMIANCDTRKISVKTGDGPTSIEKS
ncbi:Uncharacterized protein APZ42_001593 [Daphnia magna]|uniref:Uncharacterized protein n=1 Tax=Daphnia magna TaxID=35525 RepID=A0A162D078_9CRUS|nr:Uncharacterized protein APZ42_001593 [Daphnia magna]